MTDGPALYALFLAAGEGRRFGGPKLLRPHRGRPLVAYALDALAQARSDGLVMGGVAVVPDRNTALRQLARDRGLRVVANAEPSLGLSHSLRLGLDALRTMALLPTPTAALVILGDEPRVPSGTMSAIVSHWRAGHGPIVAPTYAGSDAAGHPMLVDGSAWDLVATLSGDEGLDTHRPDLVSLVRIAGTNPGIDTPDDLARLDAD